MVCWSDVTLLQLHNVSLREAVRRETNVDSAIKLSRFCMLCLKAACDALGRKRGDAFRMSSRTMPGVLDKSMQERWGGTARAWRR
jgi:hypothetical protein